MQREAGGKSSTKRGKASRKMSDLSPKGVKGGDGDSIKGGASSKDAAKMT